MLVFLLTQIYRYVEIEEIQKSNNHLDIKVVILSAILWTLRVFFTTQKVGYKISADLCNERILKTEIYSVKDES